MNGADYTATIFNEAGWMPERLKVEGSYVDVVEGTRNIETRPGQSLLIHRADVDPRQLQLSLQGRRGELNGQPHLVNAVQDAARSHFRVGVATGIAGALIAALVGWLVL